MTTPKWFDPKLTWGTIVTVAVLVGGFVIGYIRTDEQFKQMQLEQTATQAELDTTQDQLAGLAADLNTTRTQVALSMQRIEQLNQLAEDTVDRFNQILEAVAMIRTDIARLQVQVNQQARASVVE